MAAESADWPVDELALCFDDTFILVPTVRAEGVELSDEAVEALCQLDARLVAMPSTP